MENKVYIQNEYIKLITEFKSDSVDPEKCLNDGDAPDEPALERKNKKNTNIDNDLWRYIT